MRRHVSCRVRGIMHSTGAALWRGCASSAPDAPEDQIGDTDIDVMMPGAVAASRLHALRQMHSGERSSVENRKRIELQAWRELQALPDDAVRSAHADSLSGLLLSWQYFGGFWENGPDGPLATSAVEKASKYAVGDDQVVVNDGEVRERLRALTDVELSVKRRTTVIPATAGDGSGGSRSAGVEQEVHEVPRADPLSASLDDL